MSANASSILIAIVQVVMTGVGAALMDRAGRKLLLLISSAAMAISLGELRCLTITDML